ncbi:hypothetical protein EJA70_01565 [Pseudomonas sp. PB103]|nr:hypothetical protein EJA70_01565 [Pseudomonas sp. PB103]
MQCILAKTATVLQPAESATFGRRPQSFMTEVSSPASHNPHVGAAEGCDLDRSHAPRGNASWDALRPVTRSVTAAFPRRAWERSDQKIAAFGSSYMGDLCWGGSFLQAKKRPESVWAATVLQPAESATFCRSL